MRRRTWLGLGAALLAASIAIAAVKPVPSHRGPRVSAVTLDIRHRVFHEFSDRQKVKLNQTFVVGDTDLTARIVQYVPDFTMDLKTQRVTSRSEQPENPAFRIIVWQKKVPQDTTWAFLNFPPHFARKSLLAFRVLRVDFVDHASIEVDTTRTPMMPPTMPPGMPPHGATKP